MSDVDELKNKITELEKQVKNLEKDLIHDSLTGLKTRKFFEEEIDTYLDAIANLDKSNRKEWFGFRNLSILFFDLDHFKKINDQFGHAVGYEILKKVSETIMISLRGGDTAARWGGEEIVVSLLGANEDDAAKKGQELLQEIQNLKFSSSDLAVTASIGVATATSGMNCQGIVACADKALYRAKETGRNRLVKYSELE